MDRSINNPSLHRAHPLLKVHSSSGFVCSRCRTCGSGTRYSCEACSFHLHLYCATCPPNILSPLHPPHKLTLYLKHCDSCSKLITGLFYRCNSCNFDLHPLCVSDPTTQHPPNLPKQIAHHFAHGPHTLKLTRKETPFTCKACKVPGGPGKRYSCEPCDVHFHPFCAVCPNSTRSSHQHPLHDLQLSWKRCDECNQDVEGAFYRCNVCDFDLHPLCHHKTITGDFNPWVRDFEAASKVDPTTGPVLVSVGKTEKFATGGSISSRRYFFMHPEHELSLRVRAGGGFVVGGEKGWCEVCGGEVGDDGDWSCEECGFHVHESCSSIRPTVRDGSHERHVMHYQRSKVRPCAVCKENCIKWRYSCSACDVHVHKDCLKGPVFSSSSSPKYVGGDLLHSSFCSSKMDHPLA